MKDKMNHLFFKYFREISNIPRESGNEKEISDYLVNFAKSRNLEVTQDKYLNVIIKKPATKNYEKVPPIIIQGHMDMVCVKTLESNHDFLKDPIEFKIIDNTIYANNTTLGADDGVALAYSLAILDSDDLKHPKLEIVMTTEEESTMNGIMNLDTSLLDSKLMINLDSNRDDELLVSSAGGVVNIVDLKTDYVELADSYEALELNTSGLTGGHSGEDIDKKRGNAIKVLTRILDELNSKLGIYIQDITGGSSSNVIPINSKALFYVNKDKVEELNELTENLEKVIKEELKNVDDNLIINLKNIDLNNKKALSKDCSKRIIDLLTLLPNGINSMSKDIDGLVESSNNVGTVQIIEDKIHIECETRSCVKSKKQEITNLISKICEYINAEHLTKDDYSEWNYNDKSVLQEVFKNSYKKLYNKNVKIQAVHAGLETGVLLEKMPHLDIISYGPNYYELHNPTEHMEIGSCIKVWEVLINVLENTINYY